MEVKINHVAGSVYNIETFHGELAELHRRVDASPEVPPEVRGRVNAELDQAADAARKSPKDPATAKTHLDKAADILKSTNGVATGAMALAGTIGVVAAKLGLGF